MKTTMKRSLVIIGIMVLLANLTMIKAFSIKGSPMKHRRPTRPYVVASGWILQTIVPPSPIISAPFCIQIYIDGRLIVDGPKGKMVSIDEKGNIEPTDIPSAGVFWDVSDDGRIWSYNMFEGKLNVTDADSHHVREIGTVEIGYSTGSLSVAADGSVVYFTIAETHSPTNHSRLYRYRESEGIQIVAEDKPGTFTAVEVTRKGLVYIVGVGNIFRLGPDDQPQIINHRNDYYPVSISSDEDGNLYYAAFGNNKSRGIYRYNPKKGNPTRILALGPHQIPPTGLAWDRFHKRLLAVQKEEQQIYELKNGQLFGILDNRHMLSTPIAIAIRNDGEVFVNGDECGVQHISKDGLVSRLHNHLVSYQPPPAGMVFAKNGELYYTGAAPGFDSRIYRIDKQGNAVKIAQSKGSPSGIAISPNGSIYYADYARHTIFRLENDGRSIPIREGIPYPVGLVISKNGVFYVATAEKIIYNNRGPLDEYNRTQIVKFTLKGKAETVFSDKSANLSFFDVAEDGTLIIPRFQRLIAVSPKGVITNLACGFDMIRDAKIALDGSIYISDYGAAALYRLVRR